jgi:NitT/TauT family transport system permease protein
MPEGATPANETGTPFRRRVLGRAGVGLRTVAIPVLTIVLLVLLWAFVVRAFHIREYLVPTPSQVWHSATTDTHILRNGVVTTGKEVIVGFLLSVALGVPLGVALGESRLLQRVIYPSLVLVQIVPKVALGPLMIVWFGLGLTAKVVFIVLLSFFPIVLNTMVGVSSASVDFRRLAHSIGLGPFALLRKVTLPEALPSIFAGLKIGITLSVIGAVVAEFITAQAGLGFLILVAQGQLNTPLLFSSILTLTLMGLVFYGVVALVERISVPWRGESHS